MIVLVHGGQTGVDRGAHEGALDNGWEISGFMPRDRRDELGTIPPAVAKFLQSCNHVGLTARTEANVDSSDAVLLVVADVNDPCATPGTALTLNLAARRGKRRLIVDPQFEIKRVAQWIWYHLIEPRVLPLPFDGQLKPVPVRLMVAGPRASKWEDGRVETAALLRRVAIELGILAHSGPAKMISEDLFAKEHEP